MFYYNCLPINIRLFIDSKPVGRDGMVRAKFCVAVSLNRGRDKARSEYYILHLFMVIFCKDTLVIHNKRVYAKRYNN